MLFVGEIVFGNTLAGRATASRRLAGPTGVRTDFVAPAACRPHPALRATFPQGKVLFFLHILFMDCGDLFAVGMVWTANSFHNLFLDCGDFRPFFHTVGEGLDPPSTYRW